MSMYEEWHCSPEDAAIHPDVHVVGIPKAGTSFLYALLLSSPQLEPAARTKEYCPSKFLGEASGSKERYFAGFSRGNSSKLSVNGCIATWDALAIHNCVAPNLRAPRKYILVFRRPDQWQWARYILDK